MQIPGLGSGDSESILQGWAPSMYTGRVLPVQEFYVHSTRITGGVACFAEQRHLSKEKPKDAAVKC